MDQHPSASPEQARKFCRCRDGRISPRLRGRHGAKPGPPPHEAHVRRCDLKIVCATAPSRAALGKLRSDITDALLPAGFEFDPQNEKHRVSMHRRHYTKYQLPYKAIAEGKGILRPDVQIETSVFPL